MTTTSELSVHVFVSEYICSGALVDVPLPESLHREGAAMLRAIVQDLSRIPGVHITTTIDSRLAAEMPVELSHVGRIAIVCDPTEEQREFDRLASASDAVLVIAPETKGVLRERVCRAESFGVRMLNCSPAAIELCGDKLRLAEHLIRHRIPTIPTTLLDFNRTAILESDLDQRDGKPDGWVIKPRDGAGSWLTYFVRDHSSAGLPSIAESYRAAGAEQRALLQPFIAGMPLSVGCLCHANSELEVFPVGVQRLSETLQYLGGVIPAVISPKTVESIELLVRSACKTIPGLSGYFGVDLILPDDNPAQPIIVEINPRLTTSYVGYRQLCGGNIAAQWLQNSTTRLFWKQTLVKFDAEG